MKREDIKVMTTSELTDRIAVEKKSLRNLKIAHRLTDVENPLQIRTNRRFIAQLLTELRAKELIENNK